MRQTSNLGLALYDSEDKMNITGAENSLNHNMELIDEAIHNIPAGENGKDGKSAYESAVEKGYEGSEEEFYNSLAAVNNLFATDEEANTYLFGGEEA